MYPVLFVTSQFLFSLHISCYLSCLLIHFVLLLPVSNSYRILSLLSWFFTPTCISLINILLTHPLLSLSTQFLTNPLILSLLFITLYFSVIFNHDCNSPYSILSLSQFLTHPVPVFSLLPGYNTFWLTLFFLCSLFLVAVHSVIKSHILGVQWLVKVPLSAEQKNTTVM